MARSRPAGWCSRAAFQPVLPFLLTDDARLALRVSNAILIGLLSFVGWRAAQHTIVGIFVGPVVLAVTCTLLDEWVAPQAPGRDTSAPAS